MRPAGEQQPGSERRQAHPSERGDEREPADGQGPPRDGHRPGDEACETAQLGEGREGHQPLESLDGEQHHGDEGLHELAESWDATHRATDAGALGRHHGLEQLRLRPEPRVGVDVGHGDGRVALAHDGDELRRRQAAAAVVEEVGVLRAHVGAEHRGPAARQPRGRARQGTGLVVRGAGQRPRQGRAVHLAGGARRQGVRHREHGDEGRGELLVQPGERVGAVEGIGVLTHELEEMTARHYGLAA